jgi:thiamine-phosphate pyrophosphorylase
VTGVVPIEGPEGRLIVVTDRTQSEAAGRPLVATVAAVADAGAPFVLFREKDLADTDRRALGREVAAALEGTGTMLLVASSFALATEIDAAGVHLAGAAPRPHQPAGGAAAFGRSCHDAAEVAAAAAEGASWVTLSPIFGSASKPGYGPALGPPALGGHAVPVFAFGGITSATVGACVAGGAHGVAVMGAVMAAPDPAGAVRQILGALA